MEYILYKYDEMDLSIIGQYLLRAYHSCFIEKVTEGIRSLQGATMAIAEPCHPE